MGETLGRIPNGVCFHAAEEGQSPLFQLDLPEHQGGIKSERTLAGGLHQHLQLHPGEGMLPHGHPVAFSFQSAKQGVPWASGQKIPCVVWVVMVSCLDLHPNSAKFLAKSSFLLYKMVITVAPTSWGFVLRITWNNESQGLSAVFWPI